MNPPNNFGSVNMYIIENQHLEQLFVALRQRGFCLIGPRLRDGAIILDELTSTEDLPKGWTDIQQPASYAVELRHDNALFGYVVGPQSWKKFLYPPRVKLFSAKKNGKGFTVEKSSNGETKPYAFIGVRPCELHALTIQDAIFQHGEYSDSFYDATRKQTFIVAVNCTQPGGNCFCVSMNTGPRARHAYDIALTELLDRSSFAVETGTEAGQDILRQIPHREADREEIEYVVQLLETASSNMGKTLDTTRLPEILNSNFDSPHWDDVGKRCMSCANCTMVCPTCFCSTVEDVTDLTGESAERWRRWDSCFTTEFTKVAGGNIRMSTRTRYRQWMMHKLAYWHEQFGTSGCVGCGRCITWCPVGIDITREAKSIRESSVTVTTP